MTPTEVLTAARDLIADPDHWCQGSNARTERGKLVEPVSPKACRWCAQGAIMRSSEGDDCAAARDLLCETTGPVSYFNDTHTHGEVLAAFDRAIEATT